MGRAKRSFYATGFVIGSISLFLTGCDSSSVGFPARRIDLGPAVGILQIPLDTNFGPLQHWIHKSDYRCGNQLVWGCPYSAWPLLTDTAYLTMERPDSLFHFMVRLFPNDPEQCESAVNTHRWLSSREQAIQLERTPNSDRHYIVSKGVVQSNTTEWAFFQIHSSPTQNDLFEAFTERNGRGILLRWQRVAVSPVTFDFGSYCRQQLQGTRLQKTSD